MSDKSLADIVTQVQSQARYFRAVLDLADAVDGVTKLDQLRAEADARLAAKGEEEARAAARLDNIMAQIEGANSKVAQAKAEADSIVANAMRQAGQIASDAQDSARKILEVAKIDADGIGRDARQAAKDARDGLASLKADSEKAAADLDAMRAELATTSKQLADVKAAIAAALKV